MKVCYVISAIDKAFFFEQTLVALRDNGFEVCVILINCADGELAQFLEQEKFTVQHFQLKKLSQSFKTIQKCKRLLKEWKPDVVHTHLAEANWVGLWAARLAKIKQRVYTRHSGKPLHCSVKETIIDKIQNRFATQIVAISENVRTILEGQRTKKGKVVVIPHGFELSRFSNHDTAVLQEIKNTYNPEQQFPVVGVVSRFIELKGIQYIIPAFKELLKEYPNALLCLFGANENGDYYQKLVGQLKEIPSKNYKVVTFEQNVFDLYQLFDVYVHTPVNKECEGFGQTYVEVLAGGIPSVFTMSGIAPEFIEHEKNALVVPYCDSEAILEATNRILKEENLRSQLIANGKISVEDKFQFKHYMDNLIRMYQKT